MKNQVGLKNGISRRWLIFRKEASTETKKDSRVGKIAVYSTFSSFA